MGILPAVPRPSEAASPEPFAIDATITLEDRIAAALFLYRDLFATARHRWLMVLAWIVIVLLFVMGFQAWEGSGKDGLQAFATRFFSDLIGIPGLPLPLILVPAAIYYFLQPVIVRRRLRLWYRDEKLDQPFTGHYQFEAGGLVSATADQTSVTACRRLGGIAETAGHVFIQLKDIEDVIVLPKPQLSPDQVEKLKVWASLCHVDGPGTTLPAPESETSGEPNLTIRFVPTEADRAATLTWQQERPGMRRRRWRGFAMAFLVAAAIPPLLIVFAWLLDPQRVPLRYTAPLFAEMFVTDFWKWILGFWAIIGVIVLLHPWMRRSHARQISKQLHKRLRYYETEFRFYVDHLDTLQDGLHNRFRWAAFDGLERKDDYFLLRLRLGEPLTVPMRALDGDRLAIFERLVKDHIGTAGNKIGETA